MIQLTHSHLQIIYSHAEGAYPEECCGILVGVASFCEKKCIKVITTENAWNTEETPDLFTGQEATREKRYTIAPLNLLQAQKQAREQELNIIGIFHSHTDNLAIPSEFDREYAWQSYSYIIVSVYQGKARDVRSWCLDETHQFQEEEIVKEQVASRKSQVASMFVYDNECNGDLSATMNNPNARTSNP